MIPVVLQLREWQRVDPTTDPRLVGLSLGGLAARTLAGRLATEKALTVTELAGGLSVETTSFVGRLGLGPLEVQITPKIDSAPWLRLLRYALRLRDLGTLRSSMGPAPLLDLLLERLADEVSELHRRGLRRDYRRASGNLASPRGRVDFNILAGRGVDTEPRLPCWYHDRTLDWLPNQVLLAGLRFGERRAVDPRLRSRLARLASSLTLDVSQLGLSAHVFDRLSDVKSRLLATYEPAFRLISLLWNGCAVPGPAGDPVEIQGFLLDMNRMFQTVLSRFLHENLVDATVRDEHRMTGVFSRIPALPGATHRAPVPRPDFLIERGGRSLAVLDAKYRDIAVAGLPRDMLYQLAIYALTGATLPRTATLVYPAHDEGVGDERIIVREPALGRERATIALRRVSLTRIADMLEDRGAARRRAAYARYIAFGERVA